jgi:hypothetical protein
MIRNNRNPVSYFLTSDLPLNSHIISTSKSTLRLLFQDQRILLTPFPHNLSLNLPTRQLRHLINKSNAPHQPFMLRNPRFNPFLNLLRRDLPFGMVLDRYVGARPFFIVQSDTDDGGVGDVGVF